MTADSTPLRLALNAGTIDRFSPLQTAVLGFLARYTGRTRQTYTADLRYYLAWCEQHRLDPFTVKRVHLEIYIRWMLEERGLAASTTARRFTTVAMFYKTMLRDEVIEKDPAQWVERPKVISELQYRTCLSTLEYALLIRSAKKFGPMVLASIHLMGTIGLRVHEACQAQITDLNPHRNALTVLGKGGKVKQKFLPSPVMWAVHAAIGERADGPIVLNSWGQPMDRKAMQRVIDTCSKDAQITTRVTPHGLRRTCVTSLLDAGVPIREVAEQVGHADPRVTERCYDQNRATFGSQASNHMAALIDRFTG